MRGIPLSGDTHTHTQSRSRSHTQISRVSCVAHLAEMRSERGTAEQTAPARGSEWSAGEESTARMTNYSSLHGAGDRLPRWIRISPEPCRMARGGGRTDSNCAAWL